MNKWIVVTGAGGGMGVAVVQRFIHDGYSVLAVLHHKAQSGRLTGPNDARCRVAVVELGKRAAGSRVRKALEKAMAKPDQLVGLVNLAGVSVGDSIEGISDADWQRSLDVNVTAPMRLSRALVPLLRRGGGGSIVNVASPVALRGARKVSYAASKAALIGLSVAMARNLGPDGIRVNVLLPGSTLTGMTADWDNEKKQRAARNAFLGRLCTPNDVAGAIAFLVGPDSAFITGITLDVTGGALHGAS